MTETTAVPTGPGSAPRHSALPGRALRSRALLSRLLGALAGDRVTLPGDPGYDAARRGFNFAVEQRPAAVAFPRTATEIAAAVRAAADLGLRVAVWSTGHNPAPLGDLGDAVLLRTDRMRTVVVDPATRRVRAAAGAVWSDVVAAVAPHGLSVLHGSSPNVGVVGYSLGGGIGWYSRRHGLAAHRITGATLVLADGSVVRTSDAERPDLAWALRGGGASVGIVTELEFAALGFDTAYGGLLAWDVTEAERVLPVWADWAVSAPRAVTTSFRLLAVPPLPAVPAPFRGRRLVMIDGAVLADDRQAAAVLAPLRALGPEIDTFARTATPALTRLHMDPEQPTPGISESVLLDRLPPDAVDGFLAAAEPDLGAALLLAELRQLGGALADPHPEHAVLSHLPGRFLAVAAGLALDPAMAAAASHATSRVTAAVRPLGRRRRLPQHRGAPVRLLDGLPPGRLDPPPAPARHLRPPRRPPHPPRPVAPLTRAAPRLPVHPGRSAPPRPS